MSPQVELRRWYRRVGRDLPWRTTRDPYRILVSEMMLQQTQVDRVIGYYQRFLSEFPDAATLASAGDERIHRAWRGLGYPSRVERLRETCRRIVAAGGMWPQSVEALRELPGIGPYTAAALACFAFAQPVAVVDTNIARVYARRDGLHLPLRREVITAHAAAEADTKDPIAYTNALMDLGATVCTARQAHCDRCPWSARCAASGKPARLRKTATPLSPPRRTAPRPRLPRNLKKRRVVVALIHHEGRYLVTRRQAHVHAGGLWELPGGKVEAGEDDRVALARELREELGAELLAARFLIEVVHAYAEFAVILRVYRCRLFHPEAARPLAGTDLRFVTPAELVALPMPAANAPILGRMRRYHRLQP